MSGIDIPAAASISISASMNGNRSRADRPLLQTADPAATVGRLIEEREPVYQHADLTIWSRDVPHEKIVDECVEALHSWLCGDGTAPVTQETSDPMGATR